MAEILGLSVEVRHNLDRLVQQGVAAITSAVQAAARELRETHIPAEAPRGDTGALASDWVETERDPLTRIVHPGTDAWYAHIVARGRGTVRPEHARALSIEGAFRAFAGPIAGDPFHERAIAALEGRLDDLMADALSGQGL